jgi:ankyrin repeat protein
MKMIELKLISLKASSGGNADVVEFLLINDANVNATNDRKQTALFYTKGNVNIIKLLIEYNADPKFRDLRSSTPLIHGYKSLILYSLISSSLCFLL